ncbi:Peptide transport system ATP-binding protein like [Actinidia chinensis var. chinensis]|uniref:Peptide transport system ATP-binding protein like n=1 Tax=Actinidia chinensis var. chinensis TaxID=1590841 RepID=A0A2R6RW48_ACTCC|nr:Peptide transport system ATP-binding protein like [Actinidia chinensis var. chinensis]
MGWASLMGLLPIWAWALKWASYGLDPTLTPANFTIADSYEPKDHVLAVFYSSVLVGDLNLSEVEGLCSVDMMVMVKKRLSGRSERNISFSDVHNKLAYGFELSWKFMSCKELRQLALCFSDAQNITVPCLDLSGWTPTFLANFEARVWGKYSISSFHFKAEVVCSNSNHKKIFAIVAKKTLIIRNFDSIVH